MESERFDALVRAIDLRPPRRAALGLLGGGLVTLLPRIGTVDIVARKKKHKKKKKKCKSGTKKCSTKCIPENACCPGCTGQQTCVNGTCNCPSGTYCADCATGEECCADADRGRGSYVCDDGFCVCSDPVDFECYAGACCGDEVCASTLTGEVACQAGGCPTVDWCNDTEHLYICGTPCSCVTSVDNANVCTDFHGGACMECATDDECTTALGQPAVCVPNGPECSETCNPTLVPTFCIVSGCPSGDPIRRANGSAFALTRKRDRWSGPRTS